MEANISCVAKACERLGIEYHCIDRHQQCLFIEGRHLFQKNRTPFNNESMAALCKDKEHHYILLEDKVNLPKTLGFLDPNTDERYKKFLDYPTIGAIVDAIEMQFGYPVVIKQNRGALGINVFCCHEQPQVTEALQTIFNKQSANYDYVALAQQYVRAKQEIRVIYFDGRPVLSYERVFGDAPFGAKYWETTQGRTIDIHGSPLVEQCTQAFESAVNIPGLRFVALDIIIDHSDQLHLLELNSGPKFNNYIDSHSDEPVIKMFEHILPQFLSNPGA